MVVGQSVQANLLMTVWERMAQHFLSRSPDSGRAETKAQLAALPTNDKPILFNRKRETISGNIERATPAQRKA